MDERTDMGHLLRVSAVSATVYPLARRKSFLVSVIALTLLAPSWSVAHAQGHPSDASATELTPATEAVLPDAPSAAKDHQSSSFGKSLGTAIKTIGEDELHIIKSPFSVSALKWDALAIGATGVLIANDESVLHQVPASWHNTSINISRSEEHTSELPV